jgi:transcription initiation factor IIE alpha subunit
MVVNYHEILLNFSTSSDGTPIGDADKSIARTIVVFLSHGERTSPDIEQYIKKNHDGSNEAKARAILFTMEENEILRWSMRVVPLADRPMNKVCYCSLIKYSDESFARVVEGKINAKIDRMLSNFIEGETQYFCKSRGGCTNGLIITFKKMCECNNTCPACGETLFEMDDDDKRSFMSQLIENIPGFVDKQRIFSRMYETIFPNAGRTPLVPETVPRKPVPVPAAVSRPRPIARKPVPSRVATFDDALMLLDRVVASAAKIPFFVRIPGSGRAIMPPVPAPAIPVLKANGMKYFTVPDVLAMSTRDIMMECLKRWVVATSFAIDVIMQGRQSESHKKWYSMSKLFFLSSMGRKHLAHAMVGKEAREIVPAIDAAISLMESEGIVRIESSHPKFLPEGVKLFSSMCKSGDVYRYADNEGSIKTAESDFWEVNVKSRTAPVRKTFKKFTIHVREGVSRAEWFPSRKDVPILPAEVQVPLVDLFVVTVK